MFACHSTHPCLLSFILHPRAAACRIAGTSPLLFEVTARAKEQDNRDDKAYDVSAVFDLDVQNTGLRVSLCRVNPKAGSWRGRDRVIATDVTPVVVAGVDACMHAIQPRVCYLNT